MLTGERSKSIPGRPDSRPPRVSWRHASSAVRRSRPPRSVSAGPQTARASRCLQTSGRSPRRSRPCATERRAAACCEPSSCSWIVSRRPPEQCRILLPMITDAAEIRAVRAMLDDVRRDVAREGPIDLGVMIETPASAVMADGIALEADFLSIGTNDLTQYTLAMDRGHPELAARLDALHPAVLRLIARTAEAARTQRRAVAVCGGLASEPLAAPILIGLGVHELSVVPSVIAQLKALIGSITVDECSRLARQALELPTAEAVRALCVQALASLAPAVPTQVGTR